MKSLYLVDASNMFFRAFFAIPPLTNKQGLPTNALYGFLAMSLKLIREVKPDYLVYCFDRKEPSFRSELYADYKAHREEMPEALQPQIPYLKRLTDVLGLAQAESAGFEADDVIGTLALRGLKEHMQVVIVSGDKDFAQLVRPGLTLYDTMKDVRMDNDGVMAKFGVRPDQIVDYLALVGDASDNIPGVRGIGPKGAAKLLHEYGTLDGIYNHVSSIKGATQTKLVDGKDTAYMSQKLSRIVTDMELPVSFDQLKIKPFEPEPLKALLEELGFDSFARKIFQSNPNGFTPVEGSKSAVSKGAAGATVSATSSAGPRTDKPTAATPVTKKSPAVAAASEGPWPEEEWTLEQLKKRVEPYSELWVHLNERGFFFGIQGRVVRVAAEDHEIGAVLARKNLRWKGFDLKRSLKALNCPRVMVEWDSLLAAYVIRANLIGPFAEVFEQYCERQLPDLVTGSDLLLAERDLEKVLRARLGELGGLDVLQRFDFPLVPVLADMELIGIRVDTEELARQSQDLFTQIQRLEKEIHLLAGETFTIASPKQLGHILFEKLKLPVGHKTKTGYSTDSDVLEGLIHVHPIAKSVLEYRELTKLKSTYVDAIPALADPKDHRVHTHFNQAATSTGRLSSTNPNLQNIPIRTERGRMVRKAFIADPGHCLISADYSQIELRVLAHITEDPGLMKAFQEDLDIHAATASEVFNISLQEVTPEHRRIAKAVNFGLAYGQGAFGLAEVLGISRGEATDIIERYFTRFKGVKTFMEETVHLAMEQGYVSTIFGRRRYLDELRSKNPNIRKAGERAAINAPIQGTASDLVKLAMIQVYNSLPIRLLVQVHDELIFESPIEDSEAMMVEIKRLMESVHPMKVPLKVNVELGW